MTPPILSVSFSTVPLQRVLFLSHVALDISLFSIPHSPDCGKVQQYPVQRECDSAPALPQCHLGPPYELKHEIKF